MNSTNLSVSLLRAGQILKFSWCYAFIPENMKYRPMKLNEGHLKQVMLASIITDSWKITDLSGKVQSQWVLGVWDRVKKIWILSIAGFFQPAKLWPLSQNIANLFLHNFSWWYFNSDDVIYKISREKFDSQSFVSDGGLTSYFTIFHHMTTMKFCGSGARSLACIRNLEYC